VAGAGAGLAVVDRRTCGDQGQAKRQTFDREDARLLLRLLRENNFPQIWGPGPENRDGAFTERL
jgi:hypothetical protein